MQHGYEHSSERREDTRGALSSTTTTHIPEVGVIYGPARRPGDRGGARGERGGEDDFTSTRHKQRGRGGGPSDGVREVTMECARGEGTCLEGHKAGRCVTKKHYDVFPLSNKLGNCGTSEFLSMGLNGFQSHFHAPSPHCGVE